MIERKIYIKQNPIKINKSIIRQVKKEEALNPNTPNKILWIHIKSTIRKELLSRKLKDPKIRLRALENIEDFLKSYFNKEYLNPIELLEIPIETFKIRLGHYKNNSILNSAEASIINNIYKYLETNKTNENVVEKPDKNKLSNSEVSNYKQLQTNEFRENDFGIEKYKNELKLLKDLFGDEYVKNKLVRINEIYDKSEKLWEKQIKSLPAEGIKYLLIAEAPPWSSEGEVTYVYNPKSKPRTLLKALSKAFFKDNIFNNENNAEQLKLLTKQGLLIIDSLPFAMDYSNGYKRSRDKYKELVRACVKKYMLPKIKSLKLKWSEDLRIAFAFKVNGKTVIDELNAEFEKGNFEIKLTQNMIVANDAGYPDANKIKIIYDLK